MPGGDGLETLVRVKRALPAVPVFVLSMHAEEQFAVRALKAGAAGYLTKDRAPEELVTAVKRVLAGGRYVTQSLAERLITEISGGGEAAPHERLSQQEYRVMCLIAAGNTVSEIAELMHLSVKTVSTYRVRILEKLRLRTQRRVNLLLREARFGRVAVFPWSVLTAQRRTNADHCRTLTYAKFELPPTDIVIGRAYSHAALTFV